MEGLFSSGNNLVKFLKSSKIGVFIIFSEYLYITFTVNIVHNDKIKFIYLAICIICKTAVLFSNTAISQKEGNYCFFQKSQSQYTPTSKIDIPLSHVSHRIPISFIFFIFIFYVIIFHVIRVS